MQNEARRKDLFQLGRHIVRETESDVGFQPLGRDIRIVIKGYLGAF